MIPVALLVGMLIFLTFDNLLSSRAVYGDKLGNKFEVEGLAAILVNLGILGLVGWLGFYLAFLINRTSTLMLIHRVIGAISGLCIAVGLVYGLS
jgi:hypothetical protein